MKFNSELFAHFIYNIELTYEKLIETEKELISFVDTLVQKNQGEHIHFEPLGDVLRMQCSFPQYEDKLFLSISNELAPIMDKDIEARLLFVSKELESITLYSISKKKVKKKLFLLPPAGAIGKSLIK